MTRREEREAVFKTVFQYPFHDGELPEIDIDDFNPTEANKEYINNEIRGIVDNIETIDARIEANSNGWKVSRIGKAEIAILRVAAYEIIFDADIPDSVAINEAVELAKKYTGEKSPAFINGVLSGIVRM